jgi:hypothetical protein
VNLAASLALILAGLPLHSTTAQAASEALTWCVGMGSWTIVCIS